MQRRLVLWAALAVVCLLLAACEQGESVTFVNGTGQDIVVRSGFQGRLGVEGVKLASGEGSDIFVSTGNDLPLRVAEASGEEFFSHSYSWEELMELGFRVVITDGH